MRTMRILLAVTIFFLLTEQAQAVPLLPELEIMQYGFGSWDVTGDVYTASMNVEIANSGSDDAFNVTAQLTSVPSDVTITDGDVVVGDIPAGGVSWSADTFSFSIELVDIPDGTPPILLGSVYWEIEYDDALGIHHVVSNYLGPDLPIMASGEPIPEPTTMILFGTGIACLAAVGRRRKK